MTTTEETRVTPATEVVAKYVLMDHRVKEFETARALLKPEALAALEVLGGSYDIDAYIATRVEPTLMVVDLDKFKSAASWHLFNKLTKRTPNIEMFKHYKAAERFTAAQLAAISYEDQDPYIRVTPR